MELLRLAVAGTTLKGTITVVTEAGSGPFSVTTQVYRVRGRLAAGRITLVTAAFPSTVHGRLGPHDVSLAAPYGFRYRASNLHAWRSAQALFRNEVTIDNAAFAVADISQSLNDEVSNAGDDEQQIQSDLAREESDIQVISNDANVSVGGGLANLIGGPSSNGQLVACDGATRAEAAYAVFEADASQLSVDLGFAERDVTAVQTRPVALTATVAALARIRALAPRYVTGVQAPTAADVAAVLSAANSYAISLASLITQVTQHDISALHEQATQQLERAQQPC